MEKAKRKKITSPAVFTKFNGLWDILALVRRFKKQRNKNATKKKVKPNKDAKDEDAKGFSVPINSNARRCHVV